MQFLCAEFRTVWSHQSVSFSDNYLDYVYDVTVAYGQEMVQSEMDFCLRGHFPSEVSFHIRRLPISEVPMQSDDLLEAWCAQLWAKKESILGDFYSKEPSQRDLLASVASFESKDPGSVHRWPQNLTGVQWLAIWFSLCFWILTTLVWIYFFLLLNTMRLYFAVATGTFLWISGRYGGFDCWVLARWLRQQDSE